MQDHFRVRPASAGDVAALVTLVNSAYRGESSRAGWSTEADLIGGIRVDVERVHAAIRGDGHVVLVHESEEGIAGCVQLERTGEHCYLGMLTVRPTLQNGGLGRRLLQAAEEWASAQWHARMMYMTVLKQRPALIAWYERRGYIVTDERKPFPYGDERWGLPARDDLEFLVLRKALR